MLLAEAAVSTLPDAKEEFEDEFEDGFENEFEEQFEEDGEETADHDMSLTGDNDNESSEDGDDDEPMAGGQDGISTGGEDAQPVRVHAYEEEDERTGIKPMQLGNWTGGKAKYTGRSKRQDRRKRAKRSKAATDDYVRKAASIKAMFAAHAKRQGARKAKVDSAFGPSARREHERLSNIASEKTHKPMTGKQRKGSGKKRKTRGKRKAKFTKRRRKKALPITTPSNPEPRTPSRYQYSCQLLRLRHQVAWATLNHKTINSNLEPGPRMVSVL